MTKLCSCGCGLPVINENATWRRGHHRRGKGGYKLAETISPSEIGVVGTPIWGGEFAADRINEEFNDRETRLDRYEQMEKTDSVCQALYKVVTLPIRSVKWWVEPATESNEDKKIADSLTWNLIEGMTQGFDQFMFEALTCVSRGFSLFEKVFQSTPDDVEKDDFAGDIMWRKFAFRHQRTIDKWQLDKTGGLEKVHQDFGEGEDPHRVWLPIEKLLVFTHAKEGSNYVGESIYRPCWRDYYYLDGLERIEAIGLERFWLGIPWMKLPNNASTADKDKAYDIVTKIRGDEAGGLVTGPDWLFEIVRVASEGGSMNEVIDRYRRNIFLTGLAHFLSLGEGQAGSWALSRDQSTFFLYALNSVADSDFADVINKHAIPQLVKMNWPRVTKFPKLKHDDLGQMDLASFADNLGKFVSAGFLSSPDLNIEEQVREMLGVPEVTEEQRKQANLKDKQKEQQLSIDPREQLDVKKKEAEKKEPLEIKEKLSAKGKKEEKKVGGESLAEEGFSLFEKEIIMREPDPNLLERVLFTDEEIVLAVIDFTQRSNEGILDAKTI